MVNTPRVTTLIITLSCVFLFSNGCNAGEEDQEKGKSLFWAAVDAVIGLKDTHPWIFSVLVGFVAMVVLILGGHVVIKRVPLDDGTKSPVTFLKLIHRFFGVKGKGKTICNLVLAAIIFVLAFTVSKACIGGNERVVVPKPPETAGTAESAETVAVPEAAEPSPATGVTPGEGKVSGSKDTIPGAARTETEPGGPLPVMVPAVVGKSSTTARSELRNAGFEVTVTKAPSYAVPKNDVIAQTPSGLVGPDTRRVTITVSIGKFCPGCGASLEPGWESCESCGYEW